MLLINYLILLQKKYMIRILLWLNDSDRPKRLFQGTVIFALVTIITLVIYVFFLDAALLAACLSGLIACLLLTAFSAKKWYPNWSKVTDFLLIPGIVTLFYSIFYLIY